MAKAIITESYLSGENDRIEASDKFLYEISVYRVFKDRVELIKDRYYSSLKPIHLKRRLIRIKYKDYSIHKSITWLEAPLEYIKKNNFPLYELKKVKQPKKVKK